MSDHASIERDLAPLTAEEMAGAKALTNGAGQGSNSTLIVPVPPTAPSARFRHARFGEPLAVWRYLNLQGEILGFVARFDPPGERKQFFPLSRKRAHSPTSMLDPSWSSLEAISMPSGASAFIFLA